MGKKKLVSAHSSGLPSKRTSFIAGRVDNSLICNINLAEIENNSLLDYNTTSTSKEVVPPSKESSMVLGDDMESENSDIQSNTVEVQSQK